MLKKIFLIPQILGILYFTGCGKSNKTKDLVDEDMNQTIIYINEETILVNDGEAQNKQCLQSRDNPSAEWYPFCDTIKGFNYEIGYRYTLKIHIKKIEEKYMQADKSDREYTLIKIIEQILIENGVKYEL